MEIKHWQQNLTEKLEARQFGKEGIEDLVKLASNIRYYMSLAKQSINTPNFDNYMQQARLYAKLYKQQHKLEEERVGVMKEMKMWRGY